MDPLVLAEEAFCRNPVVSAVSLLSFVEIIVKKIFNQYSFQTQSLNEMLEHKGFTNLINTSILKEFKKINEKANYLLEFVDDMNEDCQEESLLEALKGAYLIAYWFFNSFELGSCTFEKFKQPSMGYYGYDDEFIEEIFWQYKKVRNCQAYKFSKAIKLSQSDFKIKNNLVSEKMGFSKDDVSFKLQDFFGSMTNSQERAIDEIGQFLDNPSKKVHILQGFSGTGKTHTTKGLTDYLDKVEKNYILIAPTGKAARVIQSKTNKSAQTIHKCIYELKYLKDNTDSYKMIFHHDEEISRPSNTVFIVDEASMISDNYSKQEYFRFGTGKLLKDLIVFTNINDPKFNNKILFIGDTMQLPPVGMQTSPALSKEYLEKTYNLNAGLSELTDVVRQQKESGILKNATSIREHIKSSSNNFVKMNYSYADVEPITKDKLVEEYLLKPRDSSIIIAYANKTVDLYNENVRKQLFPSQEYITKGDSIMAVANNSKLSVEVNNGDQGRVVDVDSNFEVREVIVRKKINDEDILVTVPLVFRIVEVDFSDSSQKSCPFKALVFENILYRSLIYRDTEFEKIINEHGLSDSDIERIEKIALYKDVVLRAKSMGIKPKSKKFQKFIFEDAYFNSLQIKFGYAITCHKSQGSEWKNVFLEAKTYVSSSSKDYLRWLYTAITRASKNVYLISR
jgi:tRNA A37 threonylcarbamoyladenosine biosynthesis protein TsaE